MAFLIPTLMEQLTQDLLERAKAVVSSQKKDYTEMGKVHRAITGTHYGCTPCNESRILYTLNSFINQPERFALRIKEAATEMEEQKQTSNYRFSKNATSKLIVLVTADSVIKVTPDNLTDEKAEAVLAHKQYAHNIERIPGTEPEQELTDDEDETETGTDEGSEDSSEDEQADVPATDSEGTEPEQELTLDQAQAKYEELTGQKPGSRNLNTLLKAIAEHESK
ncbi:hypothetical protein [Pontibacter rugosus]